MSDITKIKVDGEPESSYQLYPRNEEFAKRAGGNGGSQSGVQPDWNQNDETQPDYVKNRPFYTGAPVETVLVEESTVSFVKHKGLYVAEFFRSTFEATVGETYKVYWDGAAYECTCVGLDRACAIGNLSIAGAGPDTGEPFGMYVHNGEGIEMATADTSSSHTFSISRFVPGVVVKIDQKYLPKAAVITYDSSTGTYSSDLTNDELHEGLLYGRQVVYCISDENAYYYLMSWREGLNGRIDLTFAGNVNVSLTPDGTIIKTPDR